MSLISLFVLHGANTFVSVHFVVHYILGPLNCLFGSVKGMDGSAHFQSMGRPHYLVIRVHQSEMH